MIDAADFKMRATWFRKQAKKLGMDRPLSTLLDIFTYAHYGRAYAAVYSMADRQGVAEPARPPPFIEITAVRFGIEPAMILGALEPQLRRESRPAPPQSIGAEAFQARVKRFRQIAPGHGVKLKMTAASDLFSRAYFDRAYAPVVAALRAGEPFALPRTPEFLGAACALYGVDPRKVLVAILLAAKEPVDV